VTGDCKHRGEEKSAMQNFIFENPTKILFGQGTIARIGQEARRFGKTVLLVYGQGSIKRNGIYEQVHASLRESGMNILELGGVKSNPVLSLALKGIELAKRENVEVVLAVGGGSVIDTAKTIAAGVKADHDVWEFFTRKKNIEDALPVLTVLTISASASEMNAAAVITREEEARKYSARSPFLQPRTSVLDPTVLYTLTPAYTAYSAVDAITHALEGYFNNTEPEDSTLQDRMVEGLMKTIMENTEAVLKNPEDYNGRASMMWAVTLAFNGFTTAGMGTVSFPAHMISHALSALYDTPHGASLSIVLPGWMTHFLVRDPRKYARLAREVFGMNDTDDRRAAEGSVKMLKSWFASIGAPTSFRTGGIPETDIDKLAGNAFGLAQTWGLRDYTKDVIADILKLCR
jgi:alcohol dehydrogenase YqhD (iron-dependent ADH family)